MNSIVKALREKMVQAGKDGKWKLEELCKMAALEIETKAARIAELTAEIARLTADAKLNDMAWNDNQAALNKQAEDIRAQEDEIGRLRHLLYTHNIEWEMK